MRVVLDAQLTAGGKYGGVEQFVMALVHALGKLEDGVEEYRIVVHPHNADWLKPYLGRNQQLVVAPLNRLDAIKSHLGPLRKPAGKLLRRTRRALANTVPDSNGFYETLGAQVVHFPYQAFVHCQLPVVFNPHDLQHRHYPQFFPTEEVAEREALYGAGCREARAVVTDSRWVKNDVARQYSVPPQKIFAIPMGAPTELYAAITPERLDAVAHRFQLSQPFALYPAQTWEHKNHLRLLEAMALLRERDGVVVNLICTGKQNNFWHALETRRHALGLDAHARFLGFVEPLELRALYHLAQFVILPSLFEGGGLPVLEAFREETPVACAAVTALPEYAGDAALLFDPLSVESIADAWHRMGTDADWRATLVRRGAQRVREFTWERTARAYRALYRQLAGQVLSTDEQRLLEND